MSRSFLEFHCLQCFLMMNNTTKLVKYLTNFCYLSFCNWWLQQNSMICKFFFLWMYYPCVNIKIFSWRWRITHRTFRIRLHPFSTLSQCPLCSELPTLCTFMLLQLIDQISGLVSVYVGLSSEGVFLWFLISNLVTAKRQHSVSTSKLLM